MNPLTGPTTHRLAFLLVLLGLWTLDFGLWTVSAATVTGNLTDISIQALDTKLIFTPTNDVLVTGTGLSAGPPKIVETTAGAFSVVLEAGDYTVSLPLIPWRRSFLISVLNSSATINITNLLAAPKSYTYTNNLNYDLKATPDDTGPDVLGAKLGAGTAMIKTTNVASGVATILLGVDTNAQLQTLTLSADGPQQYYDWTTLSNGVVAVAAWNTGYGLPHPPGISFFNTNGNEMGSIYSWADHGQAIDTPELIFKSQRNLAFTPGQDAAYLSGTEGSVQLGVSGPYHDVWYLQYDDDVPTGGWDDGLGSNARNVGHSKRLEFRANDAAHIGAWPAIVGFSGGDSAAVSGYNLVRGRLRFYTVPPMLNNSGNFSTTPGIWVGEMETNGWNLRGHLIQEQQASSSSSAFTVDFANARAQVFDCAGAAITFTTANLPGGATNFVQVDLLIRSGPFTVAPTFPAWKWGNEAGSAVAPASLSAGKLLAISLRALGNTDASVLASYSIHSWPFTYDTDASAFFTRASITDDTQKLALNQLVLNAKAHGNWWAKCDAIYPFVGGTATAHSKNLKANAFNITWNGYLNTAPAHTSSGATSDGSAGSYGNTGFTPSSAGGVYVQDSAHIFVYCGTATPADCRVMGVYGANTISVGLQVGTPYWYGVINSGNGSDALVSPSGDWRGPIFMTRTGPSAEAISVDAGSSPGSVPSTGLPNSPMYIFARDDSGTSEANRFTGNLRGASIGSGLSSTDIANMKTDWDNFENTLGRKAP